jgi:hypothetical protein
LTEAKTGGVGITNDDNIVMPPDDDSVTIDDQYSNAEHGNGADGEEDDVDEMDKEEEEEQEENIENNGEVNEMPALRRSDRVSQPVRQWWMVDTRNPVNYVFNVNDTPEDEHLRKAARDAEYCTLMEYNTWDLVPAPPNRKIVGSKWVDTVK